jgi:hypothetical protein
MCQEIIGSTVSGGKNTENLVISARIPLTPHFSGSYSGKMGEPNYFIKETFALTGKYNSDNIYPVKSL